MNNIREMLIVSALAAVALAENLQVRPAGTIRALTSLGQCLIEVCALNRPGLVVIWRDMRAILGLLATCPGKAVMRLQKRYLGYPGGLADLASLRPRLAFPAAPATRNQLVPAPRHALPHHLGPVLRRLHDPRRHLPLPHPALPLSLSTRK